MSGKPSDKDRVAALRANWQKRQDARKNESDRLANSIDKRKNKPTTVSGDGPRYAPMVAPPTPPPPAPPPKAEEPDELVFKSPGPMEGSAYALDPFERRDPMEDVRPPTTTGPLPPPTSSPGVTFEPAPTSTFAEEATRPLGEINEEQAEKYRDTPNPFFSQLKAIITPETIEGIGQTVNQRFGLNLPVGRMKKVLPTLIPFFEKHGNRIMGGSNPEGFHTFSAEGARIAEMINDASPIFVSIFEALFTDEMTGQVTMTPQDRQRLATVQNEITPAGTSDFLKGASMGGSPPTTIQINPPQTTQPGAGANFADRFKDNPFLNPPPMGAGQAGTQYLAPPSQANASRPPPQDIPKKSSFFMSEEELLAEHRKRYGPDVDSQMAEIRSRDQGMRGVSQEEQVKAELEAVKQREAKMRGVPESEAVSGIDAIYRAANPNISNKLEDNKEIKNLYEKDRVTETPAGAKKLSKRDEDLADDFLNKR